MNKTSNIYLFCAFIGIAAFSIYLFPSGGIQVSHAILIVAALFMFGGEYKYIKIRSAVPISIIWLVLWSFLRQVVFSIQSQELLILPAFFLLFNVIIAFFISSLIRKYNIKAITIIYYATLTSVVVALLFTIFLGVSIKVGDTENYRSTGSFNNPNQLGYFSVCAAGILTFLWIRFKLNSLAFCIGFGICLLLAIFSLSKAAMLGIVLYLAIFVTSENRYRSIGFLLMIGAIGYLFYFDFSEYKFIDRIASMQHEGDGLMSRGYKLLFDMDTELIYGEGEGFANLYSGLGHEFHSTFGNIFHSYGLFGLAPVFYLLWVIFSKLVKSHSLIFGILILSPLIAYGISHNGIKATLAWVFLSTCYAGLKIDGGRTIIKID